MVLPIIVTIPFGDSEEKEENCEERRKYENRLNEEIQKDEYIGPEEEPFYGFWYFYPYKNPNPRGQPLSPSQLYNVLKDEFDLFIPLSKIDSQEKFESLFQGGSCAFIDSVIRHPYVPFHNDRKTGEVVIPPDENTKWEMKRIVIVAEDLNCEWVKTFQVSTFELFRRRARAFKRAGITLDIREYDVGLLTDDLASDVSEIDEFDDSTDDKRNEKNTMNKKKYRIRDNLYEHDGNSACQWLDLPSKEYCAMNGIRATYTPIDMLTINTVNLDLGNMDFLEMGTDPKEVDEEKMRKMIEELR